MAGGRLVLLGAALGVAGCGDGTAVRLGGEGTGLSRDSGSDVSAPSDSGSPDGGASEGGSPESAVGSCASGESVLAPLKALLDERVGFGALVSGGAEGCVYRVVNENEEGVGSLRYGLEHADPLWIVFDLDVTIELTRDIVPRSNKTVDGRGRSVTIRNYGLHIANQTNLIIENVAFVGQQDGSRDQFDDAITLQGAGAHTIWINHCTFSRYDDGLIDVIEGATDITISWSRFFDHNKVMLFGNTTDDFAAEGMRVTLHHNWFDGTYTYQPRIRFGFVHMYNNFLYGWGDYGVAASHRSTLLSERNIYLRSDGGSTDAITVQAGSEDEAGNARSEGDLALNGAILLEDDSDNDPSLVPQPPYAYDPERFDADAGADAGADLQTSITSGAGVVLP